MKRLLVVTLALFWGLVSQALAAGGSSDMLPGGAVFGIWDCRNGHSTGMAIQNVKDYPVGVHIVIYDNCSHEIMNFTVPLSAHDIWGGTISCQGGEILVEALTSHFEGPNNGSETRRAPRVSDYGYVVAAVTQVGTNRTIERGIGGTALVTACDNGAGGGAAHCSDDDPRNDFNWRNEIVRMPNAIILRTVIGNLSSGVAMALNGISLVDFINLGNLVGCADDENGIIVNLPELVAFSSNLQIADGRPALGSANDIYWASFNQACYQTSLFLVFPQSGHECRPDIEISVNVYDDNQNHTSGTIHVPEVALLPISTSLVSYDRGFIRLKVMTQHVVPQTTVRGTLPMFGYSIYEAPGVLESFPIVPEQKVFCLNTGCFLVGSSTGPAGTVY